MSNGVLIVGDELDDPRGYWLLERAFRRVGTYREQWEISTVPREAKAIVALGNNAMSACGWAGAKMTEKHLTGFIVPSRFGPVVPSFHPNFVRKGHMNYFGVLLRTLKLALAVVNGDAQAITPDPDNPPSGYIMYPTEEVALAYEKRATNAAFVAYDIETPYSNNEFEAEEAEGEQIIKSIQFSLEPHSGIFLPWRDPFIAISKRILANGQPKLSWNGWKFDDPTLAAVGAPIRGESHDLMWAWHHLQPDLPRGLQFAAAQLGVIDFPWKHLDAAKPQFYGIVDVDVLQRMVA